MFTGLTIEELLAAADAALARHREEYAARLADAERLGFLMGEVALRGREKCWVSEEGEA